MIRIKFEVEEQEVETTLPIESENERIKRILSLKFFGNNLNNVGGGSTSDTNNNNVYGILKPSKKSPENSVVLKKKPKLDNSTTDSFAVGSKSIKTEPAESSLSLTTQLNNSLNIQSLLRQNRIQNGWTTNEQSIPIGTQQQQQQSLLSTKIEPTVPEIHQEVPLSLDLNSLLSNLNSEESVNYDTEEIPSLVQSDSIPIGIQQPKQQQSLFLQKIEPIIPENHQEVLLSLDQSFSWIPNLNLNSAETTTANCDTTREFLGSRASLGRRAKLNVCHSVPMEPKPIPEPPTTITTTIQRNSAVAGNSESTNNDDNYSDQDSIFGFGSISGLDSSSSTALSPEAAVPLLVRKKPLPLGVPPLTLSLEEKKARKKEYNRISYLRQKTNLKLMDPEAKAEIRNRKREYYRGYMQQLMATPEQREQIRLKQLEAKRRQMENETEEQRKRRLEQRKQYYQTVDKQRKEQKRQTMTPEEREKKRSKNMESYRRHREKESEEQRQLRLERKRHYYIKVGKRKRQLKRKTMTPEEREKEKDNNTSLEEQLEFEQRSMSSSTSFNLVVDNSGKSSTNSTKKKKGSSNLNRTTIVSKKKNKRKPRKKPYELSMSIDSDSSNFDIDGETTILQSPKPGPSKLPDRSARRCQSNLKSMIYLEPSTDDSDLD